MSSWTSPFTAASASSIPDFPLCRIYSRYEAISISYGNCYPCFNVIWNLPAFEVQYELKHCQNLSRTAACFFSKSAQSTYRMRARSPLNFTAATRAFNRPHWPMSLEDYTILPMIDPVFAYSPPLGRAVRVAWHHQDRCRSFIRPGPMMATSFHTFNTCLKRPDEQHNEIGRDCTVMYEATPWLLEPEFVVSFAVFIESVRHDVPCRKTFGLVAEYKKLVCERISLGVSGEGLGFDLSERIVASCIECVGVNSVR